MRDPFAGLLPVPSRTSQNWIPLVAEVSCSHCGTESADASSGLTIAAKSPDSNCFGLNPRFKRRTSLTWSRASCLIEDHCHCATLNQIRSITNTGREVTCRKYRSEEIASRRVGIISCMTARPDDCRQSLECWPASHAVERFDAADCFYSCVSEAGKVAITAPSFVEPVMQRNSVISPSFATRPDGHTMFLISFGGLHNEKGHKAG